jgi:uncharacterized membrane protein
MRNLRLWNSAAAVLHLVQAVVLFVLTEDTVIGIDVARFGYVEETMSVEPILVSGIEIPLTRLVVLFVGISALAHILIVTVFWSGYKRNLKQGVNPYRWYEYSVSASVMIVLIALSTGITSVGALLGIFALTAVMNLMGLVMERENDVTSDSRLRMINWRPFWIGSIAGLVPWIIIGISLITGIMAADGQVPDWVIWAFVSIFIFFNSFAVNMWLQYQEIGPWDDYLFGEKMYVVLSLVAKSALAWQVYFGMQNNPII